MHERFQHDRPITLAHGALQGDARLFSDHLVTPRSRWQHLLRSPIVVALAHDADAPLRFSDPAVLAWSLQTLRQLYQEPCPPLDFLRWTKRCAKAGLLRGTRDRAIFAMVYYVSIALAQLRLSASISTLTEEQLAAGLTWAQEQNWLDHQTRQLLRQAHARIA